MRPGWLLYSGELGLVVADVLDAEMSAQTSTVDVSSWHSPFRQVIRGHTEIKFTAQIDANKMHWDQNVAGGEQPPNMAALLALARRHPDEYGELCEGEEILKALGG